MTESKVYLPSRGVNLEWVGNLELLEVNDPPKALPGATVQRVWSPDDRLVIRDAKSTDLVCFYESVAAVRHKKTLVIYVVFRETPKASMSKQRECRRYIPCATAHLRKLPASNGPDEICLQQWMAPLPARKLWRPGTMPCRWNG